MPPISRPFFFTRILIHSRSIPTHASRGFYKFILFPIYSRQFLFLFHFGIFIYLLKNIFILLLFFRYHTRAIRCVRFHPTYPLFASASDDGTIHIFHSRVYHDLLTDPLIVPLKILRGHGIADGLGVLAVEWLAGLPWLLSSGADGAVGVWCP